jgi:hypothetical protein
MTKKRITLECSVTRYGKGDYRAHLPNASGYAINGRGTTEKAAKDDLAASVAWVSHCEPTVVHDGDGHPWLAYPWVGDGWWNVRRLHGNEPDETLGMSRGCTMIQAPSFSKMQDRVAGWGGTAVNHDAVPIIGELVD